MLSQHQHHHHESIPEANWIVQRLNYNFKFFPKESVVSLVGMEIISIYGVHSLFVKTGVQVPVEFALAFAMGRPFRRLRLPIEMLGAAALCKIFPSLRYVHLANIIKGVAPEKVRTSIAQNEKAMHYMKKLEKVVNNYGAAYFISARWVGVGVVSFLYMGLVNGFNVRGYLEERGYTSFGNVIGTWAAAVSTSAVIYPISIACGGLSAPLLNRLVRRLRPA